MFQFENAEYQRLLEQSKRRGSCFAKGSRQALADLQECVEGLKPNEVDFLLALRKSDRPFKEEVYLALRRWCKGRQDFYSALAVVHDSPPLIDAMERGEDERR